MKFFNESFFCVRLHDVFFDFVRYENNEYHIDFIQSSTRGKGNASKALREVCRRADEEKINLSLFPSATAGIPHKALKAWYGRNGFVDYESGMYRACR